MTIKITFCKIVIFVIFFNFIIHNAYSLEKNSFIIGVQNFEEYLPYSEYKNNKYNGFNREILDFFASSKGYKFIYKAYPIKRLYKYFLNGKVDLKYPDNPYWSAKLKKGKDLTYSKPVVKYIDGVIVLKVNKGRGIEHLKLLGVIRGFTPFAYLNQIKSGTIKVNENDDYSGLLLQTIKRRVDGAYSNIAVSQYYLENVIQKKNALVFDPDLPHTSSHRHLSSLKHPKLINEFNNFLKTQRTAIEKLKNKHQVEELVKEY